MVEIALVFVYKCDLFFIDAINKRLKMAQSQMFARIYIHCIIFQNIRKIWLYRICI